MRAYVAVHSARSVRRILAAIRLVRPASLLAVAIAVYLGGLLADGPAAFLQVTFGVVSLAALSAVLSLAGANVFDHVVDVDSDRISHPDRLQAAGTLRSSTAWVIAIVLSVAGVGLAAAISFGHAGVVVAAGVLILFYISRLRRQRLAGHVIVGLIPAVAIVYGALHSSPNIRVWVAAGLTFVLTLSAEILGDVQEAEDHVAFGAAPITVGLEGERARQLSSALVLGVLFTSPIPFLYLGYGGIYLLALIVTDAILLRAVWLLVMRPVGDAGRASRALRWGTVTVLGSLALHSVG